MCSQAQATKSTHVFCPTGLPRHSIVRRVTHGVERSSSRSSGDRIVAIRRTIPNLINPFFVDQILELPGDYPLAGCCFGLSKRIVVLEEFSKAASDILAHLATSLLIVRHRSTRAGRRLLGKSAPRDLVPHASVHHSDKFQTSPGHSNTLTRSLSSAKQCDLPPRAGQGQVVVNWVNRPVTCHANTSMRTLSATRLSGNQPAQCLSRISLPHKHLPNQKRPNTSLL